MDKDLHKHHYSDVKNIKVAFFLNLSFTIIEIIGGILTNSVAILSDAVHDLGDSVTLGLSWYFQKLSKKPRTKVYTYGYKRFSLLGALINSIILLVGSVVILFHAIPRLFNPQQPDTKGMLVLAIIGVIVNGLAVLRLRKGSSINEKVVSLHLMEDVLGWLAVLIGALIMNFVDAPIIDPILSLAISLYIFFNVFRNMREGLRIILQGSPSKLDIDEVENILLTMINVDSVHDLHAWTIDGEFNILTIHVVLKEDISLEKQQKLKIDIRESMLRLGVQHCTIEFELQDEDCEMDNCY
ncbi:MAG TPA: cation diffusion facilitator family transporter [Fermentimonas sp.]|nr:cation diffusion facilitator family transporter [Fermentimonas sp.]